MTSNSLCLSGYCLPCDWLKKVFVVAGLFICVSWIRQECWAVVLARLSNRCKTSCTVQIITPYCNKNCYGVYVFQMEDIWSRHLVKKWSLFTVQNEAWHVTVAAFIRGPHQWLLIMSAGAHSERRGIWFPVLPRNCFYMPPSDQFSKLPRSETSSMLFPQRNINFLMCFTVASHNPPLLFRSSGWMFTVAKEFM